MACGIGTSNKQTKCGKGPFGVSVSLSRNNSIDIRALTYSGYSDTLNYGFADLAGAADAYRKALRYQPGEKMLTFQYVEALYEQSRFREGLAAMEDLRRRTPHDLDVLIILANLYWC